MKIVKDKTVSFIGHKILRTPDNTPDRNLENVIRTELFYTVDDIYKEGKTTFLVGMEPGFDLLAAEAILGHAWLHENIRLCAIILFEGQELEYSRIDKLRYNRILKTATDSVIIGDRYSDNTYFKRNDFLIGCSSEIVVYDSSAGLDTKYAFEKAIKNGFEVCNMYEGLEGYFSTQNPVKQFLQTYPAVTSFKYSREGVIFGDVTQPIPIKFSEIAAVEKQRENLCFTLTDGIQIIASLCSDDYCVTKLPFPNFSTEDFC